MNNTGFILVTSLDAEDCNEHKENKAIEVQRIYDLQSSLKKGITRRISVNDLGKPADLELANQYRNQTCFRKWKGGIFEYFDIWSTDLNEIGKYNLGIELYLNLVKRMAWGFFFISTISIYSVYITSKGAGLKAGDIRQKWDIISIGNLNNVTDDASLKENESTLRSLFVVDALCSFLLIIFIIYYQIKSAAIVNKQINNTRSLEDFSVKVKGIPEFICDSQVILNHFSQFGEVHEVFLAKRYEGILSAYSKRADLMTKYAYYQVLKSKGKKVNKTLTKIYKKIQVLDEKIQKNEKDSNKTHDELPTLRGYIVFKTMLAKKKCLLLYRKDTDCCKKFNKSKKLYLLNKYPLRVIKSDSPSNIILVNLEITKNSRMIRRLLSLICIIFVFFGSMALNYSLKLYQNNLPKGKPCDSIDPTQPLSYAETNYIGDIPSYCWCKAQPYRDLLSDSKLSYCSYYYQRITLNVFIRLMVSFGIVFINFVIKIIVKLLGKFERLSNRSKEQRKVMNRVFYATFINTALITLFVNADFYTLRSKSFVPDSLFSGDFNDFSRLWYTEVGSTIVSTMIIQIFTPHWLNLLILYPIGVCKRRSIDNCVTQGEANERYAGGFFDLAIKNANVLKVIFTCYLYSAGLPVLNIICFLCLAGLYWIEKFLVLRHYEKPPMMTQILNDDIIRFLPFSVVLHCGFSLYMFSASDIFPYELGQMNRISERVGKFTGVINIGIIILALSSYVWVYLYGKCFNWVMRRRVTIIGEENVSIMNELRNLRNQGLDTYDICKHPDYMGIIRALNTAAELVKEREAARGK